MKILTLTACLIIVIPSWAEEVFVGIPLAKTELSGEQLQRTQIDKNDQLEFKVIIVKEGDRFFWKTREMKELTRHQRGRFVTYQAVDGTGYVRVDLSGGATGELNVPGSSLDVGYLEHLKLGLNTITYQGRGSE